MQNIIINGRNERGFLCTNASQRRILQGKKSIYIRSTLNAIRRGESAPDYIEELFFIDGIEPTQKRVEEIIAGVLEVQSAWADEMNHTRSL